MVKRPFKIVREEVVHRGKFITRKDIYFLDKAGNQQVWEAVKRNTFGKIVAVFPLTSSREVVLEKIFRVPLNRYVIEFPAGLADKEGESAEELARRELLEETGYKADKMIKLIEGPFNAGLLADEMILFFAPDIIKVQEPMLEDTEDLEVITMPLDKLVEFVQNPPDGVLVDIKLLSGLPVLQTRHLI